MFEFTPELLLRLGVAAVGGVVIGLAVLVQIIMRDAFADRSPLLTKRQYQIGLVLRVSAAITAFAITVLVFRLVSEEGGRTVLSAAGVLAGLVLSVLLGKRFTGVLAARVRNRLRGKKAVAMRS